MRIIVMGQAPFGAKVLETLLDRGEDVVAAYAPADTPGGKDDALKALAVERKISVYQPAAYKKPEALEEFRSLNPDLLIMAFVTDIIPDSFFDVPAKGTICYHPSILPRHRGASAINWAVIMGDQETGLSIFWPDAGIDTGPVLLQKRVAIQPEDTTGSLYFNHLFSMGVEAIVESVDLIKSGKAPRIVQDESLATYEPICNDDVAKVDWAKPAQEVYNLIRGCDPQPGAYSMFKGGLVRFYGAKPASGETGEAPGTVFSFDDGGLDVAAQGGSIRITKVRSAAGKVKAGEFARDAGVKLGDRFE